MHPFTRRRRHPHAVVACVSCPCPTVAWLARLQGRPARWELPSQAVRPTTAGRSGRRCRFFPLVRRPRHRLLVTVERRELRFVLCPWRRGPGRLVTFWQSRPGVLPLFTGHCADQQRRHVSRPPRPDPTHQRVPLTRGRVCYACAAGKAATSVRRCTTAYGAPACPPGAPSARSKRTAHVSNVCVPVTRRSRRAEALLALSALSACRWQPAR